MSEERILTDYAAKGWTQGGGSFNPIPEGKWTFKLDNIVVLAPDPSRHFVDQTTKKEKPAGPTVRLTQMLIEKEQERAKTMTAGKLPEGTQQSVTAWKICGYTWGTADKPSSLFDYCCDAAGPLTKRDIKRWLSAGGRLDPKVFQSIIFRGFVEHKPARDNSGRVWVNVEVQSLDEYEESNRKLVLDALANIDQETFAKIMIADAEMATAGAGTRF